MVIKTGIEKREWFADKRAIAKSLAIILIFTSIISLIFLSATLFAENNNINETETNITIEINDTDFNQTIEINETEINETIEEPEENITEENETGEEIPEEPIIEESEENQTIEEEIKEDKFIILNSEYLDLKILPIQQCFAQDNVNSAGSWNSLCNNLYPGTALFYNDSLYEKHSIRKQGGSTYWAGIKINSKDEDIVNCNAINQVSFCYKWWSSTSNIQNCDISVDSDNGDNYSPITLICPDVIESNITCIDVTSLENWDCNTFFGENSTGALAKSELKHNGGGTNGYFNITWDVFYFSVNYSEIPEENLTNITELNISIKDAEDSEINSTLIIYGENNEIKYQKTSTKHNANLTKGKYKIVTTPLGSKIKQITLNEFDISQNDYLDNFIKIDNSPIVNNLETIEIFDDINSNLTNFYAIDPSEINFTNGTLTVNAVGNSLWKCKDWDFESRDCLGTWNLIQYITPGQDYFVEISSTDPGFAEANVTINAITNYTQIITKKYNVSIVTDTNSGLYGMPTQCIAREYSNTTKLNGDLDCIAIGSYVNTAGYYLGFDRASPNTTFDENGTYRVKITSNIRSDKKQIWYAYDNYLVGRTQFISYAGTGNDGFITYYYTNDTNTVGGLDSHLLKYAYGQKSASATDTTTSGTTTSYDTFDTSTTAYTWVAWYSNETTGLLHGQVVRKRLQTPGGGTITHVTYDTETTGSDMVVYENEYKNNLNTYTNFDIISGVYYFGSGTSYAPIQNLFLYFINPARINCISNCSGAEFTELEFIYTINSSNQNYTIFNITGNSSWGNANETVYFSVNNISNRTYVFNSTDGNTWNVFMNRTQLQRNSNNNSIFAAILGKTETAYFKLETDTQAPKWSNNSTSPLSPHQYNATETYYFNITWIDNVYVDTVLIEHNFTGTLTNYSTLNLGDGIYSYNYTGLNIGTYQYKWYANDSENNRNMTDAWNYIVNATADDLPIVTLNYPIDNYYNDSAQYINVTFNCSATDDKNLANISLYITNSSNSSFSLNQTSNISGISNSSQWTLILETGNYTWNCLAYDNASQTDWADFNRSLKINYTAPPNNAPQIILNEPINNIQFNNTQDINFNFTATDDSNLTLNCSIYLDGILNQTNSSTLNNTLTNFLITGISNGNHNWSINCSDGELTNISETRIFSIDVSAPSVEIKYPLGHNIGDNRSVAITVNITDPSPIDTILANITYPNGSSILLSGFGKGIESDNFDTDTENINWVFKNMTVLNQSCYGDIDGIFPGKMFIAVDGGEGPTTAHCAFSGIKRLNGGFDINLTFNITLFEEDSFFTFRVLPEDVLYASGVRAYISVLNKSGNGIYRFVYTNETYTNITEIQNNETYGKLRIVRFNVSTTPVFNLYYWNNSGNHWINVGGNISAPNSARTQFVQIKPGSESSSFGKINVTIDDFQISSDSCDFAIFNDTANLGRYNFTIIVNDTLGYVNNTESSYFNITQVNDPPSRPYFEEPDVGDVITGLFNITWGQVYDREGDNVQFNITLLNSDGTDNATLITNYGNINTTKYLWNTSAYSEGLYSIKIVVFENETAEKLSVEEILPGTFSISRAPEVIIKSPLGETFGDYRNVPIVINASDLDGIATAISSIKLPNSTEINITLKEEKHDDDFDSDTLGIDWLIEDSSAGSQICTADIDTTISGKAFTSLVGDGTPETDTLCSLIGANPVYGDFDSNISFEILNSLEQDTALNFIFTEIQSSSQATKMIFIALSNWTGYGGAYEIFADDGNFSGYINTRESEDTSGKMRIKREGDNFSFYTWNNTDNSWILEASINLTMSKALYPIFESESAYPNFGTLNVSWDNFSIFSENLTIGIFNQTDLLGTYNITFFVTDTLGVINNTEKTNFTIVFINDPPSTPFLLLPYADQYLFGNMFQIYWTSVFDEENDELKFNITLLNPDLSVNSTIITNYGNENSTFYLWDTTNHLDGEYSILLEVFESNTSEGNSKNYTLDGTFLIDNTLPFVEFINPTPTNDGDNPAGPDGTAMTTNYNQVNATMVPDSNVYFRFYLDVPGSQEAGHYMNLVMFKAAAAI